MKKIKTLVPRAYSLSLYDDASIKNLVDVLIKLLRKSENG